jgi:hypothetical protein
VRAGGRRLPGRGAAAAVVVALLLGACSGGAGDPTPTPSNGGSSPTAPSTPAGSSTTSDPSGGTSDAPEPVEATRDLLPWQPAPGTTADTVTVGEGWTLTVAADSRSVALDGDRSATVPIPASSMVADTMLSEQYAVVVAGDKRLARPDRATVIDLATGDQWVIDGRSDVATVSGGSWALDGDRLWHPTFGPGRAYCLAAVDLADRASQVAWCADAQHGFTNVEAGPGGTSLMLFDDARPSCRTLEQVTGTDVTPFAGVTDCRGWDGLLLADSRVWTVPTTENRIEEATVLAAVGDEFYDLGAGRSGTLVACGGAAYFARDPGRDGGPAQVVRWQGGTLSVVYESPAGGESAIAGAPRCSDGHLTVSVLSSQGDEQVTSVTS